MKKTEEFLNNTGNTGNIGNTGNTGSIIGSIVVDNTIGSIVLDSENNVFVDIVFDSEDYKYRNHTVYVSNPIANPVTIRSGDTYFSNVELTSPSAILFNANGGYYILPFPDTIPRNSDDEIDVLAKNLDCDPSEDI